MSNKKSTIVILFFVIINITIGYFSLKPYFTANAFIGHADQANVANLAQNIVEGNGFVVDNIWLHTNGGMPGNQVTHPETYWSVYVGTIISLFFKIFGISRLSLVLPALLLKVVITALISKIMWDHSNKNLFKTLTLIVAVSLSPNLLSSVSGLSDMYLTAAVILSTLLLTYGIHKKSLVYFLYSGLVAGIGYGFKPTGIMLFGLLFCYFIISKEKIIAIKNSSLFVIGFLIAISPYFYYNKINHNTFTAPAFNKVMQSATIRNQLIIENNMKFGIAHNNATFNPQVTISKNDYSKEVAFKNFTNYIEKGFIAGKLIKWWISCFFCFGIFIFIKNFKFNQEPNEATIFQIFSLALIFAGFLLSFTIHFETRYWLYIVPFVLYFSIINLNKFGKLFLFGIFVVSISQGTEWINNFRWKKAFTGYDIIQSVVPENTSVFTSNPWQLAFYTRIPAVATPVTEDINAFIDLSKRYNSNYLIIINNDIRDKNLLIKYPEKFLPIYSNNNLVIYKLMFNDNLVN